MDSSSNRPFRNYRQSVSLRNMSTSGPKYPTHPVGPPRDMSITSAGVGIRYQEFEDGWVYELYAPVGAGPAITPRAKAVKLIFSGQWLAAFEDEREHVNYFTLWLDRKTHEEVFPQGPPMFRYYDDEGTRDAGTRARSWIDPNETNPSAIRTGELKLVELARLEEAKSKIL